MELTAAQLDQLAGRYYTERAYTQRSWKDWRPSRRGPVERLRRDGFERAMHLIHAGYEQGLNRRQLIRKLATDIQSRPRDFGACFSAEEQEAFRGEFGVSLLVILSVLSVAINLVRLWLEWKDRQRLNGWKASDTEAEP